MNSNKCSLFARDQSKQKGVTMIEYALIAALIAVVAIAGVTLVGTDLSALFTKIAGNLK